MTSARLGSSGQAATSTYSRTISGDASALHTLGREQPRGERPSVEGVADVAAGLAGLKNRAPVLQSGLSLGECVAKLIMEWMPAEKDGKYVASKMILPIEFKLDN